jgi:hypothetical protein
MSARRTKIPSLHPPLPAISTAYPTEPIPVLFDPIVQPASRRPRGHLDRYGWVNFPAIIFGKTLQVVVAEIHIYIARCQRDSRISLTTPEKEALARTPVPASES